MRFEVLGARQACTSNRNKLRLEASYTTIQVKRIQRPFWYDLKYCNKGRRYGNGRALEGHAPLLIHHPNRCNPTDTERSLTFSDAWVRSAPMKIKRKNNSGVSRADTFIRINISRVSRGQRPRSIRAGWGEVVPRGTGVQIEKNGSSIGINVKSKKTGLKNRFVTDRRARSTPRACTHQMETKRRLDGFPYRIQTNSIKGPFILCLEYWTSTRNGMTVTLQTPGLG